MDDDGVLRGVGPRLRQLRLEREATLTDLAEETGISVSTLSRLESGQRKPTLELLLPLARAHRVALDELVDAPETGDPRIRSKPVVRHGRTFISLTKRPGGLQSFKMVMPVERDPVPTLQTHEGYEWLYVLSGRVRLVLGTFPYQVFLAAAAVRAAWRELRGDGSWEKTEHSGAHIEAPSSTSTAGVDAAADFPARAAATAVADPTRTASEMEVTR